MSSINRHENGADEEEGIKGALRSKKVELKNILCFCVDNDKTH